MNKINKQTIKIGIFVAVFIILLGGLYINKKSEIKKMQYTEFLSKASQNKVEEVQLNNSSTIKIKLKDNKNTIYTTDNPRKNDFKEYLLKQNIKVVETNEEGVMNLVQLFIAIAFFYILFRTMKKFSNPQSKEKMQGDFDSTESSKKTFFADIAGNEEAKESVRDLVDFIKNPEKYMSYGARIPRGVLLYGPPGTGKTLMAKAISGEAGVPFFAVSGSDFVQMYVGVGASRVRELFKKAREKGKAVIFIDEIDALGKKRVGGGSGGNDERDQTLNALLMEMSGFNENEGIVVIAATNRLDTLDEALLRPGRFDRHVEIGLPDVDAREKILKIHARNKPLAQEIDLAKLAKQTVYFSGAMLENLLNEAAIFAAKSNTKKIALQDVDKAFYTVIAGFEKKNRSGQFQKEKEITAYHEAGHTLVTKSIAKENSVSKVTIIPSTKGAGGFSMNIPPDKMYATKKDIEKQIQISLAGRIAEEIIFGEENITTGASNDIEKATTLLRDYAKKYGMSKKIGMLNIDILTNAEQSNLLQNEVLKECKNNMNVLYQKTKELIIEKKYYLHELAQSLLIKETLNEEEIDKIMAGEKIFKNKDEYLKRTTAGASEQEVVKVV